jgi:PleD family two-component response regulator
MSLQDGIGGPTHRVLLVEDEALVAMIAADSLQELGYDVTEVGTARAALDCAHSDCAKFDFAPALPGSADHRGFRLRRGRVAPQIPGL